MPAPYTPCPGGFVTSRVLDGGRILVEGFALNLTPIDGGDPRHEIAYTWIDNTDMDAADTIAEFTRYLTTPPATPAAPAGDSLVDFDDPYSNFVNA